MSTHTCKAVVIHCIDFRFRKSLAEFLESQFQDSYDLISAAGGVKNTQFVLEQVKISNALHAPQIIVLIQHEDCGAYGGSKAFQNWQKELEFQKSEVEKAEKLLQQQFSQSIEKYLLRLSGEMISF